VITKSAEIWRTELVFILLGRTDVLQPLDRRMFGILKAYARHLLRKHYHKTHEEKTTRSMLADNLLVAWDRITKEFIDSAWTIYQTGWGEDAPDEEEPNADDGDFDRR
jgi:hypothetical protein